MDILEQIGRYIGVLGYLVYNSVCFVDAFLQKLESQSHGFAEIKDLLSYLMTVTPQFLGFHMLLFQVL